MNKYLKSWSSLPNLPLLPSVIMGILPWIAVVLLFANLFTTAALIFLLMVITGLGYLPLAALGFVPGNVKLRLAFAPATGFILLGAYFALAARFTMPIKPVFWVFAALGVIGFVQGAREIIRHRNQPVPGGIWLVLLSVILALTFYRPYLLVNGVELEDGRYTWMDVDANYHMAVAASIKISSPPAMPGLSQAELVYHYAAYAIAGCLSAATDLELAESMHVLPGVGLIVLFLATIGCSHSFAKVFGDRRLAASCGVLGLFFSVHTQLCTRNSYRLLAPRLSGRKFGG